MDKYTITLQTEEREQLEAIIRKGAHAWQKVINALILLNCDEATRDRGKRRSSEEMAEVLQISARKIDRVKRRFVEEGFEVALSGQEGRKNYDRVIDGDVEAHLVALSCSEPPQGQVRWTLRLLAQKAVELEYIEAVSHETVRQALKKNELKPWKKVGWVIPPESNAEFVAAMENVLDVYRRPYDAARPVVCMDKTPRQLIGHVRTPVSAKPGQPAREDYEYERLGVCNVFMANEPLAGRCMTKVT